MGNPLSRWTDQLSRVKDKLTDRRGASIEQAEAQLDAVVPTVVHLQLNAPSGEVWISRDLWHLALEKVMSAALDPTINLNSARGRLEHTLAAQNALNLGSIVLGDLALSVTAQEGKIAIGEPFFDEDGHFTLRNDCGTAYGTRPLLIADKAALVDVFTRTMSREKAMTAVDEMGQEAGNALTKVNIAPGLLHVYCDVSPHALSTRLSMEKLGIEGLGRPVAVVSRQALVLRDGPQTLGEWRAQATRSPEGRPAKKMQI